MADDEQPIVVGRALTKRYGDGATAVDALRGVEIALARATLTAIMGPSGSGKSTLMQILAGLDTPSTGQVEIGGVDLSRLSDGQRTRLRRTHVGFVFQSFNLLPMLTVAENIALPVRIAGQPLDPAWLDWLLGAIGMQDRRRHRPAQLSGGEQQRVSLARALVSRPAIVFADEPTGNLDSRGAEVILTMLRRAVDDLGQTIAIITHDAVSAARADRVLFLQDGVIARETAGLGQGAILDVVKGLR